MNLPALIIVSRINLALQTRDRMRKNGINCGICYGKGYESGRVVVSTIGSVKRIPDLHNFKILIVDEVHRAQANQYQDFIEKVPYPIRFGFSATPNSGDKYKWAIIRQFFGNIIYSIDSGKLMEKEVIAKPEIFFVESPGRPTENWYTANMKCIIENEFRNKKIKEFIDHYDTQTLVLIRNIEHGELLNDLIPGSVFVSGIDDAESRKEVIEKFEKKELQIIISTGIFNEGISINEIRLLVIASGGKARTETMQKLGRGLRTTEDKKTVTVIDFDDIGNYFTEKHSTMRKNLYKKNGFDVKDWQETW